MNTFHSNIAKSKFINNKCRTTLHLSTPSAWRLTSVNKIKISYCTFTNNTSEHGGVIYITDGLFMIINCVFTNNHRVSDEDGAAIVVRQFRPLEPRSSKTSYITNTILKENFGYESISIFGRKVSLYNTSFSKNVGGIYLFNCIIYKNSKTLKM